MKKENLKKRPQELTRVRELMGQNMWRQIIE